MDNATEKINSSKVSILMLTYNRAHFLPEAIASVLSQTYSHWELFIIDDGSTDSTSKLIADFSDARIKYIRHTENGGLFVRRAESLGYATGDYIAILDSDDYWTDPEKLATQVDHLDKHPACVVVGTQSIVVDVKGKKIGQSNFSTTDHPIRAKLLLRNQFTHSSVLMRATAVHSSAGYQPTLAEDLELFLSLGKKGEFANINLYMTAHRQHSQSENDHGIKIRSAIQRIIKNYQHDYPGYIIALTYTTIRITLAKIITRLMN